MKHSWLCADVWRLHCGAAFYAKTVNKDRAFIPAWLLPAEQVRNGTRSVLVILSICINLCIVNSSFTVWLTMSSVLHSEATRRKTFSTTVTRTIVCWHAVHWKVFWPRQHIHSPLAQLSFQVQWHTGGDPKCITEVKVSEWNLHRVM